MIAQKPSTSKWGQLNFSLIQYLDFCFIFFTWISSPAKAIALAMVAQTSNSFFKICFVKLNQLTDARIFSTCLSTYPFTHTYLFSFSVDQRQNAPSQVNLDNGRIHTAALSQHFLMLLDNGRTNCQLLQESLSSKNF